MAAQRSRRLFKFWLNLYHDTEYEIAESLEFAKRRREYTGIIRDGIRLILSLRQGHTDVLFELFPWLKNELSQPVTTIISASQDNGLQGQLQRLEQLILQQGSVPIDTPMQAQPTNNNGPKALSVPQFSIPDPDDDDTVVLKQDTSTNSAANFINSMLNLQQ